MTRRSMFKLSQWTGKGVVVLSIALVVTLMSSVPSHAATPAAAAHPYTYTVYINLSEPKLTLYKGTKLVKKYRVALGKPSTPTPVGNWKIIDKQKNWGAGFGTRWLGLDVPWGTYGIHGTNKPDRIGRYVSNGCIRMRNSDVEALYRILPVGTPVRIDGNPLKHLRLLEYGNIGADVQIVQKKLKQFGYYKGKCDGRFGPKTQFAVQQFQLAHKFPMVGTVGMKEYNKLGLVQKHMYRQNLESS